MLFPSIYYFLYFGSISILFPFLALFYQSQGLTGGQIGLLAAIYTAGVYYTDQIALPGMQATTQDMFNGTLFGFGSAAGGLLGGLLLAHFSPNGMYAFVGTLVLAGMIAFLLIERRLVQKKQDVVG